MLLLVLSAIMLMASAACTDSTAEGTGEVDDTSSSDDQVTESDSAEIDRPHLILANGYLPGSIDPASEGFNMVERGIGETLTRIAADQSVEMRLAESVEMVDEATWDIVLREGVMFWDGIELASEHVADSFERAWEQQPATGRFVSSETEIEIVDDSTLRLHLPEPDSALPNNLAAFQLIIYREDGEEPIMTGPYRPIELNVGEDMTVEAFDDYWEGQPPYERMTFRLMADGNARMIAVQAGDVDISMQAPPEDAASIEGDVETVSTASSRVHYLILSHEHAPFDDSAVRRAVNLAIDRDELNSVALSGLGQPVSSIIPPGIGFPTPAQLEHNVDKAGEVLHEAGWQLNEEGIRVRDGERLEFTIKSYPFRPELTTMAVSMQDQLGRLGFEVSVLEFDDIVSEIEDGEFQASMFSVEMLPTGDPHYSLITNVWSEAIYNYGGYESDELDSLLDDIQREVSVEQRDELILEAQEIVKRDDAMIFLAAAPRPVAFRPDRVQEPMLHPSDMYFVDVSQPAPAR
jgi:peptide/nickel transport system substrate-binding protein